jgi:hypothetical protein
MGDEKFRYYVVYERQGDWNAHSITLDLEAAMESDGTIEAACDLIRERTPYDGITITNWKRVD